MKKYFIIFLTLNLFFVNLLISNENIEKTIDSDNTYLNSTNPFLKAIKQRQEVENLKKELKNINKNSNSFQKETSIEIEYQKQIIESKIKLLSSRYQDINQKISKITVVNEPYNLFNFFTQKSLSDVENAIKALSEIQKQYQEAINFIKEQHKKVKEKIETSKDQKSKNSYKNSYITLLQDRSYIINFKDLIDKQQEYLQEQKNIAQKQYYEYRDEVLIKHLLSIIIILSLFIGAISLRKIVSRYVLEDERQFMYNRTISSSAIIIGLIFILVTYSKNIIYSLTVLTFLGAAIIIATREFSLNLVAWIYISIGNFMRVGDRVLIPHETKYYYGDVINISPIKITIYETYDFSSTKEAINAGRIIFIPNSYVFSHAIINYTHQSQRFIYDHLVFNLTLDSNLKKAEELAKEVLKEEIEQYFENAKQQFSQLKKRYDIKQRMLEPEIQFNINTTSTGIKMSIWYLTPILEATFVKNKLLELLLIKINATQDIDFSKKSKPQKESLDETSES